MTLSAGDLVTFVLPDTKQRVFGRLTWDNSKSRSLVVVALEGKPVWTRAYVFAGSTRGLYDCHNRGILPAKGPYPFEIAIAEIAGDKSCPELDDRLYIKYNENKRKKENEDAPTSQT